MIALKLFFMHNRGNFILLITTIIIRRSPVKAKLFFFIFVVNFFNSYAMDLSKKSSRGMLPLPKAESIVVAVQGSLGLQPQLFNTAQIREKLTDIILKNKSNAENAEKKKLDCSSLGINAAIFKPNATEFVCAYNNLLESPLKIWSGAKKSDVVLNTLHGEISAKCLAFSHDGEVLLTGIGNVLYFCDTKTWRSHKSLSLDTIQDIKSVAFSRRGQCIVVGGGSGNNNLVILTLPSGGYLRCVLPGHREGGISCVGFSPDATKIVSVCENTCRVWDIANKKITFEDNGTSWSNCKVEYDRDNGWFLTGYDDVFGWFLYDLNKQKKTVVPLKAKIIPRITVYDRSPCGTYIFLGSMHQSGDIHVFNIRTGKYICSYSSEGCGISTIACSADGEFLVVAVRGIPGDADLWVYNLNHKDDPQALQTVSSLSPDQIDFVSTMIKKECPINLDQSEYLLFDELPNALKKLLGRYIISPQSIEIHDKNVIAQEGWDVMGQ